MRQNYCIFMGWTIKYICEKRQLSCPYNPIPQPTFDENIKVLKEWITDRNKYLKATASRKLKSLKNIELTLDRALEIQDSIFSGH